MIYRGTAGWRIWEISRYNIRYKYKEEIGMDRIYYDAIEGNPVIAAVKDMDGLRRCCELEDIRVVFILFGDICSIGDIVGRVKETGRLALVHVDLVTGLSSKEVAVDYIREHTEADGIIKIGRASWRERVWSRV